MAWEILKTVSGSGGTTLSTGTFTAKKDLRVIAYLKDSGSGGNIAQLRFNGDSGTNYTTNAARDGGSNSTWTSINRFISYHNSTVLSDYLVLEITNISDKEKMIIGENTSVTATGAGTVPARQEWSGKWANTSAQITSLEFTSNGSGFTSDSYITVLGAKEPATANVMTVSGMTAKKNLMIQAKVKGGNGNTFTFNNDTGNNYAHRYSNNGGSDGTQTSRANLWSYYDGNDTTKFTTLYVVNEASKEKLIITENVSAVGTGAGTAPQRTETTGKWANTSNAITRVDVGTFTTNGIEEGSEVVVWGSDGASDTTHPTIVNGFILEETDTGKHYIWNATTSTWTEIA
jgi:hypothetical protein